MDILAQTIRYCIIFDIRHEIAKCSEKAYADLPLADAVTLLYFKTDAEVLAFAKERNWKVEGKQIVFGNVAQGISVFIFRRSGYSSPKCYS